MANLPENPTWEPGIYQLETTDPVVGGPPNQALGQGISNIPAQQLANRTKWLNDQITALQTAVGSAASQADIDAAINALIGGAPAALDTLNELAAALADDANYATNITNALAGKVDLVDDVLSGALGAKVVPSVIGSQDWNAAENTKSGVSKNLLIGTWPNGPGNAGYYHVMNFEYVSRGGGGNVTQVAIPYIETGGDLTSIHYRVRRNNIWSAWMRVLNDEDLGPAYEYILTGWAANTTYTLLHGLGVTPSNVETTAVCKVAERGWAVGDEVAVIPSYYYVQGLHNGRNTTEIKLVVRNIAIANADASTSTSYDITSANWDIKVRAWA